MIIIIDHKLGNIFSIYSACKHLGYECKVSSSKVEIKNATKLILPGVGHFSEGMRNLRELDLIETLNMKVCVEKTKILGICLGCQLLLKSSDIFLIELFNKPLDLSASSTKIPVIFD